MIKQEKEQYCSYIVAVIVGGENMSNWRKQQICRQSLTKFIT
jgi:hypothetical protein